MISKFTEGLGFFCGTGGIFPFLSWLPCLANPLAFHQKGFPR